MKTSRTITGIGMAGALALALGAPAALAAQDSGDFTAYNALVLTTTAGLPPMLPEKAVIGTSGALFALRVGRIAPWGPDDDEFTNGALSVALPVGARGGVGGTVGMIRSDCEGCDPQLALGASGTSYLLDRPLGAAGSAPVLALGVRAEAGWTSLDTGIGNASVLSGAVGIPATLSLGSAPGITVYLTPALGYGRVSFDSGADGGTRPLLGGGVALSSGAGAVFLGFQRVFIEEGRTLLGAGAALRMGGSLR